MKGQIPMIEMIIVAIILLVGFQIFFPGFSFKDRWNDATLFLKGRDIVLTLDRSGILYDYSFNASSLQNFVNKIIPEKNIIAWSEVHGTLKDRTVIACNCTSDQTEKIIDWIGTLKLNNRSISVDTVQTSLDSIIESDVLVIWDRQDLQNYKSNLLNYLSSGNGIVEIVDITKSTLDSVQKEIFGIENCQNLYSKCDKNRKDPEFIVPTSASQMNYDGYKTFYNLPLQVEAPDTETSIPVENGLEECSSDADYGNFKIRNINNRFWICENTTVYFDTNHNNKADIIILEKNSFAVEGYNFVLSYIEPGKIYISFKPRFVFKDFPGNDVVNIQPIDKNPERILLAGGSGTEGDLQPFAIVNKVSAGKTAWVDDFTIGQFGEDEKLLFTSLVFSTANKKSKELMIGNVKLGFLTPYINSANTDMFEIYQFNLGLGFPF